MTDAADAEMLCTRCREPKRVDEFPRRSDPEKPLYCLACKRAVRRERKGQ